MKKNALLPRLTAVLAALLLLVGCAGPENEGPSVPTGTVPSLAPATDPTPSPSETPVPEAPEDLVRVPGQWFSSATGRLVDGEIAFSDDWFFRDPAAANPALALCSMQIEAACGDAAHGAAILRALGFSDAAALHYDAHSIDECAFTSGEKILSRDGTDYTLRAVFLQGIGYDSTGWEQNVLVNDEQSSGAHRGYLPAVQQVAEDFAGQGENVIWWIVGYSRGGGIANLLAAALAMHGQTVFAYTFASPAVTDAGPAAHGETYAGIHNYYCDDDPVPMVPPWGMVRYGRDHSLSDFSPEEVTAALQQWDPAAYEAIGAGYDGMWLAANDKNGNAAGERTHDFLVRMTGRLEASVPSRADYSAAHTDRYTLEDGTQGEIVWSPQASMLCLVRTVSGSGLPIGDTASATPLLAELIYAELEAALAEQNADEAMAADDGE